jgi:hypothetical protein
VHEAEDEPLLFTVRCQWPWTSRWEVRDADGNVLGKLWRCRQYEPDPAAYGKLPDRSRTRYPWLASTVGEDKLGRRFLVPDGWQGELAVSWVGDVAGGPLALVEHAESGLRVIFPRATDGSPFAKMLVLAALLVAG